MRICLRRFWLCTTICGTSWVSDKSTKKEVLGKKVPPSFELWRISTIQERKGYEP